MDRNALMSVNPLAYGMHDVTDRGSFLPLGRYPYGYDLAWPQPVADMGNTLLSVMRGQPVDYNALIDAGATAAGMATLGGFMAPKPRGSIGVSGGRGPSGLDMSPEARLARARDMGFDTDTVWYHVTDSDFDAFDNAYLGRNTQGNASSDAAAETSNLGHWFTSEPEAVARMTGMDETGGRTIPVYVRGGLYDELESGDPITLDYVMNVLDARLNKNGDGAAGRWKKSLKKRGYHGISLDDTEFGGRSTVVFDPKDIRSVNAAFDPKLSNSADLLALNRMPVVFPLEDDNR